jgi:hypothetical protein
MLIAASNYQMVSPLYEVKNVWQLGSVGGVTDAL